ncbi:3-hydroxybutyryl-CoA dehydrogenase [Saccharothrix coeruleofusca]|uniref:3-hydroxybutyryl-CoA dehydrogenase n=1 Tax=Saccharothrix coeruleofusca TaxID=33919 RepID=A0A918AS22_9PSEU|nr:3-hydroxybutyryl-CoA dehydrogenase [Saccharothrix coeruleofusca]MBP2335573.1 3-hydroxybutyryl-CoA dehydrogenase [Saccharothrix coeruleofusca]GGP79648.1 3-hydroxybutyryl-CoA dehydrogenase [Saccharothrix coeruleofusca]
MEEVRQVGVVGCGVMGAGIVDVCAQAGLDVRVVVSARPSVDRARARVLKSVDNRVRKGLLSEQDRDALLERVSFTDDFAELRDRQFVVEAVPEDEEAKRLVLKEVDAVVESDDAVIASTTSSIPITALARGVERPERVIGAHFFNPAPAMRLVELTAGLLTAQDARVRTEAFVTEVLGKRVVWCQDRAGFVVNSLLVPYLLSGIRMLESGFAAAEDIDAGMELGCAHPMGPLRLCDLIGLDVVTAVARAMYEEYKEPLYSPPSLLLRMVDAGLLGRKTGRGFHDYRR